MTCDCKKFCTKVLEKCWFLLYIEQGLSNRTPHKVFFYENINIAESKLFFIKNQNTRHNIFGLWSLDLMEKLEADILKGERKVEVWADSIGVKIVNIDYKKPDPFFNINTEEDFRKAIKMMDDDKL